jgi:hypothetical protein
VYRFLVVGLVVLRAQVTFPAFGLVVMLPPAYPS